MDQEFGNGFVVEVYGIVVVLIVSHIPTFKVHRQGDYMNTSVVLKIRSQFKVNCAPRDFVCCAFGRVHAQWRDVQKVAYGIWGCD